MNSLLGIASMAGGIFMRSWSLVLLFIMASFPVHSAAEPEQVFRWEKLPPIPDPEGFAAPFAGVSGGALIVAGGANITGDKWADVFHKTWYDFAFVLEQPDGAWRTGFKLPHPLGYGVSITTRDGVV